MKTTHTPGTWKVHRSKHEDVKDLIIKSDKTFITGVLEVNGFNTIEEAEANARLIAAAPELLDALQSFTDAVDFIISNEREFDSDRIKVHKSILANHGDQCETYKTAKKFLDEYLPVKIQLDAMNEDEDAQDKDIERLDDVCEDLITEFEKSLLEDYSIMLQKESEYLQSKEAIIETIEANEYTFEADGKMRNS